SWWGAWSTRSCRRRGASPSWRWKAPQPSCRCCARSRCRPGHCGGRPTPAPTQTLAGTRRAARRRPHRRYSRLGRELRPRAARQSTQLREVIVSVRRSPRMNLLQINRQPKPHVHAQGDACPLCEQPIGQDIARRIEERMREQREAAVTQTRAEMAAAAEQAVAAARSEAQVQAKAQAEAAAMAKLADMQARLTQAEQARA